ncbi:MAG: cytochrome c biogenesis protein CcsA [Prevotella sp.]|jgi:ABC-type transport system involved in cytochrome c biogenesis permease subunit|nr:cytochrome c biogenesis protein CcsA [Prevotella sp.]
MKNYFQFSTFHFPFKYIAFGTLIALLLVLAGATVAEKVYGREFAAEQLYGAWWFVMLWIVLGGAAFAYIFSEKLYRAKAVFLLHISFGIILLGAFITFMSAERGYIHLRQNETVNTFTSENDELQRRFPFDLKLLVFEIQYRSGTDIPVDFVSYLRIDGEVCRVAMNRIHSHQNYRFYQLSYDSDELGSTLLVNYDPYGIAVTYVGYALLAIAILWLLWLRLSWKILLGIAIAVAALWYYISQLNPMTPILRSPMLAAHVSVIMASYALLILIAILSVVALCSEKKRNKLYRWNVKLLYPALFLLSIGIFLGAVWANISWGRYWGWDAKETWALITMLIYAIPLHRNSFRCFRNPRNFHLYCSLALLTVAMTFFGVSFLLGGMHSYVG